MIYIILFFIWWQFQNSRKIMSDAEIIINNDKLFADTIDTPKKGGY